MAIKQIVPILITLQGDGSATAFTFALSNLYQGGVGGSIPFGTAGVVPSSVTVNNPPVAVASSTVDANGNLTITFSAAPANGTQYTLEVDLSYNSGAATSSTPVQSMNVNVTGGTITANESFTATTGTAVPATAAFIAGKNAGNLVGVAVDSSGNVGVNVIGSLPAGSAVIGAVTQSGAPWSQNLTQVGGTAISLGAKASAASLPVVLSSDQAAITVAQATAANFNATVVGTGTFAVQAAQSGTWNIGTLSTISNPVTVVGQAASGATNAGNPVKIGGVFNSTQPTVTTGQAVDAQMTARGAQIVATGTDAFTVAVSGTVAVTQSGTWNIGTVSTLTSITNAVTVAQSTAANLNATVVGTGSFAVQASQTGSWSTRMVGNAAGILDGAQNTVQPANALVIAGVYNSAAPTITSGNLTAMQTDANGFLKVNIAAGSTGNSAASATGAAVPAFGDYTGLNVGGTMRGWTGVNPSGSVYAGQMDLTSIAGSTTATAATGVLKVGVVGSAGAVFDAAQNATAPANVLAIGGVYSSTSPTITTGALTQLQTDVSANLKVVEKKDTGRTYITWFVDAATLITTESLISIAVNKGGVPQTAATTYTVTSGKTLRIQSLSASVQGSNSSVQTAKVRIRSAASVTSSSAVACGLFVANSGATNSIGYAEQDFPDGLEISGGQQVGISQLGGQVNGTVTVTLVGYEY